MKLDNMFKKNRGISMKRIAHRQAGPEVPEGLMRKCNQCGKEMQNRDTISALNVEVIFMCLHTGAWT